MTRSQALFLVATEERIPRCDFQVSSRRVVLAYLRHAQALTDDRVRNGAYSNILGLLVRLDGWAHLHLAFQHKHVVRDPLQVLLTNYLTLFAESKFAQIKK